VLSDLVESLAGAVFLDSDYSLDTLWDVFKEILKPLVTPETLRLEPTRELRELCQKQKFGGPIFKTEPGTKGHVVVSVTVQLKNETVIEYGRNDARNVNSAKKIAAIQALVSLKVETLPPLFRLNVIWSVIVDHGVAECTQSHFHGNRPAYSTFEICYSC
jgi:endoribonuclease Dicer